MLLDTTLFVIVALTAWEWNVMAAGAFWALFTFITGAFLSSNFSKIPKGAWFRWGSGPPPSFCCWAFARGLHLPGPQARGALSLPAPAVWV